MKKSNKSYKCEYCNKEDYTELFVEIEGKKACKKCTNKIVNNWIKKEK